ncbi:hypothetical protein [Amycolatopsis keratiniphila]|uniref:Uncharacterized protein n=1 Tax=Amycolatopsis keratiniphila TaxID=129921 RepID=W6HVQ0_9PSEU|nr:hypothetical protein [Amycolatopsis keratiniphila]AHJ58529.1 hypothetical protein AORI_P014 [Amycolatopsis keratiniphila]
MGLFSTKRDPEDPEQLQIAVHELGHAFAWKLTGSTIREIRHTGDEGWVDVRVLAPDNRDFAIGLWAGFEAEDRWLKANNLGRAKRGNSSWDIGRFNKVRKDIKGGLSESKARSLARPLVNRCWSQILETAPKLIRDGTLHI